MRTRHAQPAESPSGVPVHPVTLDTGDEQRLLSVARHALSARVRGGPPPDPPRGGVLDLRCGVFVSIHAGEALRGCLGDPDGGRPLGETVVRLAGLVADSDPRFEPLTVLDLDAVALEVSVLTPLRPVQSAGDIDVGRHGIVVEWSRRRGLLLPRVAVEHGWDRDTLLDRVCVKAGLPPDDWRRGARLFVFEAHVFGERTGG